MASSGSSTATGTSGPCRKPPTRRCYTASLASSRQSGAGTQFGTVPPVIQSTSTGATSNLRALLSDGFSDADATVYELAATRNAT